MNKRTMGAAAAAVVLATGLAGTTVALAGGSGDDEGGATGADKAVAAAIAETGGHANAVERDSEDGAVWEVEVTKPDGSVVDVRLDGSFHVMKVESDSESHDSGTDG